MIDFIIILTYLLLTLIIGLRASRNVNNMRDFAIANRTYPTFVLVATMCATAIGSENVMSMSQEVFDAGIIYLAVCAAFPLQYLGLATFLMPRMQPFIYSNCISVGDIMHRFYGKPARVITGLAGALLCVGYIGAQICAIGYFCNYFIGLPHFVGILLGAGIVVTYSTLGGIRAVTLTDIIQFCMLIVIIPIVGSVGLEIVGGWDAMIQKIPARYLAMEAPVGYSIWKYVFLFFVFLIPDLDPAFMQRFLMAKNTHQMRHFVYITAMIVAIFLFSVGVISFSILAIEPNLDSHMVVLHFINTFLPQGIRGLAVAGMLAVIMSTADSYLNVGSISFVHDFLKPLLKKGLTDSQELKITRYVTFIIGIGSILGAIVSPNIMDIVLTFCCFWLPVVSIPLMAGILGFRGTTRAFVIAAIVGLTTALGWGFIEEIVGVDGLVPSMAINALVFFTISIMTRTKEMTPPPPCTPVVYAEAADYVSAL